MRKFLASAFFVAGLACLAQAQIPNVKIVGFGTPPATGPGGNDSCTKSLLTMDGANGGTTFTDTAVGATAGPHTWTATSATTSTASVKFGTASFLGGPGKISTADSTDWDIGTGNFTIDFWFNRQGTTGARALAGHMFSTSVSTLSAWAAYLDTSNKPNFQVSQSSLWKVTTSATSITDSNWHHYAGVKSGTNGYLFIDGIQVGSITGLSVSIPNGASTLAVGRLGDWTGYPDFNKNIDEFRYSIGASCGARWTSNFTPPTSAYTP